MHKHSIRELSNMLEQKKVSAVELATHCLERIEKYNPLLNAVVHYSKDNILAQAKNADQKRSEMSEGLSPLAGIPILNKDIFCTVDQPTTCASKALKNYQSPFDASLISNFRQSGIVMLGKCNMDEFAMGGANEYSVYGPCRNPWNTDYVPGGSSGGSSSAVAARLAPAATGTDTGGSIRQPAAFCGITGIKPSYGVVSRYGMIAFASSLDQAGPMAVSAEDCAILLSTMAKFDPKNDMTSVKQPCYDYTSDLENPVKGLKIGLPKEYFSNMGNKDMRESIEQAIQEYKKLGVEFVEISLPDVEHCISAYYTIAPCEASSNLARFDGNVYGYRCDKAENIEQMYARSRSDSFGDEVKRRIIMGTYALSSGYSNDYYAKAQNIRNLIRHDFDEAWQEVDLIMAPTTPSTAFRLNALNNNPLKMYQQDVYTIPVNLAELPALSMPIGFCEGLPLGLQLIGPKWQEKRLLNCAHQYQKVTDWHLKVPQQFD